MSSSHARFAPSKMEVTINCPASVQMQESYPQQETDDTREGTAAHYVASDMLMSYKNPDTPIKFAHDYVGKAAPNGVVITLDMARAAGAYVEEVLYTVQKFGALSNLHVEDAVPPSPAIHLDNWGTPDSWFFIPGHLYIYDFKFGFKKVDAYRWWQGLNYASLIMEAKKIDDATTDIHMVIVQPRAITPFGSVDRWTCSGSDLRAYTNRIMTAIYAADEDSPQYSTGHHCINCSARWHCEGGQKFLADSLNYAGPLKINEMGLDMLAKEWIIITERYEMLKSCKKDLEAYLTEQLKSGTVIPDVHLEPTQSKQVWNDDAEHMLPGLSSMFNLDLKKPGWITPKQAIAAGIPRDLVKTLSEVKSGGVKLVASNPDQVAKALSKSKLEKLKNE